MEFFWSPREGKFSDKGEVKNFEVQVEMVEHISFWLAWFKNGWFIQRYEWHR